MLGRVHGGTRLRAHAFIKRWLVGELVNNTIGIKDVGGPFHGRTELVQFSADGTLPTSLRASGGRVGRNHHI
ncbi:hypothetical protein ACIBL6_15795 [Streptomyces sp. NPDC050400]|uniref:hypothetical protein n=1 Tax=Streptomyces sp. NPDC050400 TaxID=3365610 RepID=UPI00379EC479